MNKSLLTNLLAASVFLIGYFLQQSIILYAGLFALSGAITNWLAIHMLFEKVPGLYGSGIIPAKFEAFKIAINNMMMEQFFNQENIENFISKEKNSLPNLEGIIQHLDLSPAFEKLVNVIMQSSFGGMLGMFGGKDALTPLEEPFIINMKESLIEMVNSDEFNKQLSSQLQQADTISDIKENISQIIQKRLNELTPDMVKLIVQEIIKEHLGWLVVWGGVFGGLIGLISALLF